MLDPWTNCHLGSLQLHLFTASLQVHSPAHHGPLDELMYPIEVGRAADKCRQRLYNAPLPSDYPPTRRATITSLRPLPTWWCGEWRITDVGLVNGQQPRHHAVLVTMSPPPPPPPSPSQILEMHGVLGNCCLLPHPNLFSIRICSPQRRNCFSGIEKNRQGSFLSGPFSCSLGPQRQLLNMTKDATKPAYLISTYFPDPQKWQKHDNHIIWTLSPSSYHPNLLRNEDHDDVIW